MEDNFKNLAKVKTIYIDCSSLVHQATHFIIEGYQICQAGFPIWKSMLTIPSCFQSCKWFVGYMFLHFLRDQSQLVCSSCIPPSHFLPILQELLQPYQDKRVALQWYWPTLFALMDESHQVPWTSICKICLNVSFLDPFQLKVVLHFFRKCVLFFFFFMPSVKRFFYNKIGKVNRSKDRFS